MISGKLSKNQTASLDPDQARVDSRRGFRKGELFYLLSFPESSVVSFSV